MAKAVYEADNTELDGTDETFEENVTTTLEGDSTLFHYHNGTDVSIDFVLVATAANDSDFSQGVQLDSATVASGDSNFYVVSDPWEKVQVTVTQAANPGSGSVTVYRMSEQ